MAPEFTYANLDSNALRTCLESFGQLTIRLPKQHASAFISLIELTRITKRSSQLSIGKWIATWLRGLIFPFWVFLFHFRLHELYELLVDCDYFDWHSLPSGEYLFHYQRSVNA
jgi:hypothetical protein